MAATLLTLADIISSGVRAIHNVYSGQGMEFPSLNEPYTLDSEALRNEDQVQDACVTIAAAAFQLIATIRQPQTSIFNATCAYYLSATLRVACETNVVEVLRDVGPSGMHVDQIGRKLNLNPLLLGRILRYLATHHIFQEVSPDVFANNRLSSVIDKGKSVDDLLTAPLTKFDMTNGIGALVGHWQDYKGAGFLLEHLTDPETGFSSEPSKTPMLRAFGASGTVWDWFESQGNEYRFKRFGVAMDGVNSMQPPDAILKGFDWKTLPEEGVIVDVGAGIGVSSVALAKALPAMKFVIQDRPKVLEQAVQFWDGKCPEAVQGKRVTFQPHDFFDPQPVKNPSAFILKQIVHDWADEYAERILRRLREAVDNGHQCMLVIIDSLVPYACRQGDSRTLIPGERPPSALQPLLPNYGPVDASPYFTDLSMWVHFNGQERTSGHMERLLEKSGWKLTRIYYGEMSSGHLVQFVATPL
ncbi:S-adenosyl-L-methionine-dependent methyltransferase [Neolentinus lepideus HHB14362 ss-1]|uniref:S-adenosyl-L-methionine-dependent methyltransferase n=1 Tax=Neolentinus lepideus HHB14362 ss-1 TaxID=1314782 RepID=A0A165VQ85_9AGAM|nr:S-adenosyl-L-methionine-dependent methyltransferase [Neolentinus lepideus HHB14362 ss-1]